MTKNTNTNKKAFVLFGTTMISIFIIMLIGTYYNYTIKITSLEFHKDLAKIRGYWAVYGAKELESEPRYKYYKSNEGISLYDINTTQSGGATILFEGTVLEYTIHLPYKYSYSIDAGTSIITNDMIHRRKLRVDDTNNSKMESYFE